MAPFHFRSKKKKLSKTSTSLRISESYPELRIIQLLPDKIRSGWLEQLRDSDLFDEGDDQGISQCLQHWGIFIVRLLRENNFNDTQTFIDKASKLALKQYPLYQEHGWPGLTMEVPFGKRSEEEEENGEEEDNDEWFEFINTDFFLKFNLLLNFVASSAFQFELFKTIFKTPEVIRDVQYELPYSILRPKIIYVQESSFQKLNNVIGPAYDFTPINNIPDVILPLSMSSDVNDDFWIDMINEQIQINSIVSSQNIGG